MKVPNALCFVHCFKEEQEMQEARYLNFLQEYRNLRVEREKTFRKFNKLKEKPGSEFVESRLSNA